MSETGPVCIITNPIAGRGEGVRLAGRVAESLTAAGMEARIFLDRVAKVDLPERIGAVVVIGGDGTLREVTGQLVKRFGSDVPPLLPLPMGTANLMVRHLGIDRWPRGELMERVVGSLRGRRIKRVDAAAANGELFLLMLGAGIDAEVVHELSRRRNGPISMLSYVWPTARAVWRCDLAPMTVTVDGRRLSEGRAGMVMVANIPEYGTGFPILPEARPDDGWLDVCVLPFDTRAEMLRVGLHAAAGEHLQMGGVMMARGRRVRIESDRPVAMQVDGEAFGHTPVEIDLLPYGVPFIVPG